MAEIETGKRDASLNVVPFIDLMSTLTAFLLVTAVWSNDAASPIHGRARDAGQNDDVVICSGPEISVLVTADRIVVGETRLGTHDEILKVGGEYDWPGLTRLLRDKRIDFVDRTNIDLAAESTNAHPIAYQQLVQTSDVLMSAGFTDVTVVAPQQLYAYAEVVR